MKEYVDIFEGVELDVAYGPALSLPETFLLPDGSSVCKYTLREVDEMSRLSAEYEEKIKNMMVAGNMSGLGALSAAGCIEWTLGAALETLMPKKDYNAVRQVSDGIKNAYLLAAKKVTGRNRNMVVDASSFWNQKAIDMQFKLIL